MPRDDNVDIDAGSLNDINRTLKAIEKKYGPRIGRKAVNAGGGKLRTGIRRQIPSGNSLKKNVGWRNKRNKNRAIQDGKVGFNVGKKQPAEWRNGQANKGAIAHIWAMGSKERRRRRIGGRFAMYNATAKSRSTGRAPSHDVVPRGVAASINDARQAMRKKAKTELAKAKQSRRR